MSERSERRAQPAVGDNRCATREQLIVVFVRNRLDVAWGADRVSAQRWSKREDCLHCLAGNRVADALDEG